MLTDEHRKSIAEGQRSSWERRRSGFTREELLREKYRRHWAKHILRRYGLTVEVFAWMLYVQEFRCALCRKVLTFTSHGYAIDHDAHTERIRGVLCGRCNYRHVAWVEEVGLSTVIEYLRGDYYGQ